MAEDRPCSACGGRGLTEKTSYRVEYDADGKQIMVPYQHISQCSSCGGSGRIA